MKDVIVIGAGATGLMAARELSKAGMKVIVLEARNREGGRIHTIMDEFGFPVEAGAEFIHGDLPLTQSLLKEASIPYHEREGEMYRMEKGKLQESDEYIEHFDSLISKLKELEHDMPFSEFLDKYFGDDKYKTLRDSATRFAEGYDTANVERVSSIALREEWTGGGTDTPYYVQDGYGRLIDFLSVYNKKMGCEVHYSTVVKEVKWQKDRAEVITASGDRYAASKCIVTVPLAVLLAEEKQEAYIRFTPAVPNVQNAAKKLGFGAVIKFLFAFKDVFWDNEEFREKATQLHKLGFLITDAAVPVWWTDPHQRSLLTGWLGGPEAEKVSHKNDEELLQEAIRSLAFIFGTNDSFIKDQLTHSRVINWNRDPFALGAYAYATVNASEAIKKITEPVEGTLYFAGEAFQPGEVGTVEGALASGKEVAEKILQSKH